MKYSEVYGMIKKAQTAFEQQRREYQQLQQRRRRLMAQRRARQSAPKSEYQRTLQLINTPMQRPEQGTPAPQNATAQLNQALAGAIKDTPAPEKPYYAEMRANSERQQQVGRERRRRLQQAQWLRGQRQKYRQQAEAYNRKHPELNTNEMFSTVGSPVVPVDRQRSTGPTFDQWVMSDYNRRIAATEKAAQAPRQEIYNDLYGTPQREKPRQQSAKTDEAVQKNLVQKQNQQQMPRQTPVVQQSQPSARQSIPKPSQLGNLVAAGLPVAAAENTNNEAGQTLAQTVSNAIRSAAPAAQTASEQEEIPTGELVRTSDGSLIQKPTVSRTIENPYITRQREASGGRIGGRPANQVVGYKQVPKGYSRINGKLVPKTAPVNRDVKTPVQAAKSTLNFDPYRNKSRNWSPTNRS